MVLPEILYRFFYHEGRFQPGNLLLTDPLLKHCPLIIHTGSDISIERLRTLSNSYPEAVLDIADADEGDVVDSVMLGMRRVTVDGWNDIAKVKMAHALCPKVITRFVLNDNAQILFKRLWHIRNEIQPPILLIGSSSGDLIRFVDEHATKLSKYYSWLLAPADGRIANLSSTIGLSGWCISPHKLLTGSSKRIGGNSVS